MELNIWIALGAGLASFISPCTLPLYPSYLSYITGISVSQLTDGESKKELRRRTVLHTLFFILGFSIVYYALGYAAGIVAEVFYQYNQLITQLAGLLIIVMGLFLMGLFQPKLLLRTAKVDFKRKPAGYVGSTLIGIGFAAGWSPCIGPILGAIIGLASTEQGIWFQLITAYTIGFAVPFFLMAFFLGSVKSILKYSNKIMKVGGAVMIVVGVLLFSGQFAKLNAWLNAITPEWLQF